MSDMTRVKNNISRAVINQAQMVIDACVSDHVYGIVYVRCRDLVWQSIINSAADLIIDHVYESHDSQAYEV